MTAVKFGFTAQQLVDQRRTSWKDIDGLKPWLSTQELPQLTDEQIVLFLLSCSNDPERTKTTIKAHYCVKNGSWKLFDGRKTERKDLQQQLKSCELCVFPERTDDGCAIVLCRVFDTVYSDVFADPLTIAYFMVLDATWYDNPPTGLIILLDTVGLNLMHLTRFRLRLFKPFFQYLQEGLPLQLKIIHVLNSVYLVEKILGMVKPFLKAKILDLINFHQTSMDLEAFHEKWIPKRCLPEEYGGDLPPIRVLQTDTYQKLVQMQGYFDAEEFQRRSALK